tara:strand:- start:1604 stop:1756 length:153 start_codon:yes stop_codon:yes gene_type:complete
MKINAQAEAQVWVSDSPTNPQSQNFHRSATLIPTTRFAYFEGAAEPPPER